MDKFEQLIKRSYEAVKGRELINENTTSNDFYEKIYEEYTEFCEEYLNGTKEREVEECIDFITTGIMYLHHNGYDVISEFEKGVIKNETRAKEFKSRLHNKDEKNRENIYR